MFVLSGLKIIFLKTSLTLFRMKNSVYILLIAFQLFSCSNHKKEADSENSARKEVMDIAIKYVKDKFKETKETVAANGIITITDNQLQFVAMEDKQTRYIIDPARIIFGLIDADNREDAILTINSFRGRYEEMPEHLIFINSDGSLMLSRVIESDMKILGINDRIITAEVYTHSLNSPLHDCASCKEVVRYQFRQGDLIKAE
jgi:hypothetical protein